MKKTLSYLVLILLFNNCGSAPKPVVYKLKGSVDNFEQKKVFLSGFDKELKSVAFDTVIVQDGIFEFKIPQQNPEIAIISFEDNKFRIPVIIGDGDINMLINKHNPFESDLTNSTSRLTRKFFQYQKYARKDKEKGMVLTQKYRMEPDVKKRDSLKKAFDIWRKNAENYQYDYIKKNKDMAGLIVMQSILASQDADYQKIRKIFETYPESVSRSNLGKHIKTTLLTKSATEIGGKAPNFIGTTPDGKKLSLNRAMGKVTVIDFWASWCRPCRAENPYVVEIYNKYHDRGLNIIGVSLDKSRDAWLKAIEDDGLKWQHVSELKFWKDPIAKIYGVMSIPQVFILDAKGVIRAKNLRREALENKIKELLEE